MQIKIIRPVHFGVVIILIIGSLIVSPATTTATPSAPDQPDSIHYYLPIITKSSPPSIFGAETWTLSSNKSVPMADQADLYWVRNFLFPWDLIEATPGVYDWSQVDEAGLLGASSRGLSVIATIKFTPSWAQKVVPYACGPIRADAFDEFARFVQEVVRRYSQYPYNLKTIQFGNEPDVGPELVGTSYRNIFGCWGDETDYYYGGGYYAEMLKVVYPAIKAVNPSVQVMIGGLLQAQDPTNPAYPHQPSRFFEGIIRNHGAKYFDIVSFHAYPSWTENAGLSWDDGHDWWVNRGGLVVGKISYLREVMDTYETLYGYPIDKPIVQTEGALNCYYSETTGDHCDVSTRLQKFYQAQADYGVILFTRNWAQGLLGTVWYTIESPGWQYSSLLYSDGTAKPVYYAVAFLRNELRSAWFTQQITIGNYDPRQLQAYEFTSYAKRIWVLWVADLCRESDATCVELEPQSVPVTITLPSGWQRVLNVYGEPTIPVTNGKITILDNRPIYIEIAP